MGSAPGTLLLELGQLEALPVGQDLQSWVRSTHALCKHSLQAATNYGCIVFALCAQLQQLNGVEVAVVEKVDAANLVGGATDGLVAIRKQFFPNGELEDGGGAVPPTAAGIHHPAHDTHQNYQHAGTACTCGYS